MKLTISNTEVAQRAVQNRCIRPNQAPLREVANVFGYINLLNRKIKRLQANFEEVRLEDILLTSGLAQFIEPREIKFDITNECQANLRDLTLWNDPEPEYVDKSVPKTKEEITLELTQLIKSNPQATIDDIEDIKIIKVLSDKSKSLISQKCPSDYDYLRFRNDLVRIQKAMGFKDVSLNANVRDAIRDVNVMTIVDKIVMDGNVNWDGTAQNAFVPFYLSNFNVGLDSSDYNRSVQRMIDTNLTLNIEDIFTK